MFSSNYTKTAVFIIVIYVQGDKVTFVAPKDCMSFDAKLEGDDVTLLPCYTRHFHPPTNLPTPTNASLL